MNSEQFRESKSLTTPEKVTLSEVEKNKKVNALIQDYADLGAITLSTVPVEEYDEFKDEFLAGFKGTDQELADAIRTMHEQPVYSDDGIETVAYQVYAYTDMSDFSEEQLKKLDDINEKMIEMTRN